MGLPNSLVGACCKLVKLHVFYNVKEKGIMEQTSVNDVNPILSKVISLWTIHLNNRTVCFQVWFLVRHTESAS
ncbi:uncharacterized protein J3R85_019502 [Psidium guajava]|nr:uncharacterized protein J3R85_019502 [Psidium guajava]